MAYYSIQQHNISRDNNEGDSQSMNTGDYVKVQSFFRCLKLEPMQHSVTPVLFFTLKPAHRSA